MRSEEVLMWFPESNRGLNLLGCGSERIKRGRRRGGWRRGAKPGEGKGRDRRDLSAGSEIRRSRSEFRLVSSPSADLILFSAFPSFPSLTISRAGDMKRSGIFFASAIAASSAAFTSSDDRHDRVLKSSEEAVSAGNGSASACQRSPSADMFAPRFDGLRFMETLVTAHR